MRVSAKRRIRPVKRSGRGSAGRLATASTVRCRPSSRSSQPNRGARIGHDAPATNSWTGPLLVSREGERASVRSKDRVAASASCQAKVRSPVPSGSNGEDATSSLLRLSVAAKAIKLPSATRQDERKVRARSASEHLFPAEANRQRAGRVHREQVQPEPGSSEICVKRKPRSLRSHCRSAPPQAANPSSVRAPPNLRPRRITRRILAYGYAWVLPTRPAAAAARRA